ncbi:purine-binding chemotaxis protein CheW [Kineococcus xinjiangensis]|uniref:Purine-binding chemotaxis protein CheW n=1 Tax=Kineococcus xinjiangensis TaxID=512762 RepID=A0A2S6IHZ2_9ACTN|nr:chemotaxis protein CheW [Kineococcus xinjiangensis]PPK93811.1 purine-binding chemotaxis protein CheW [Kineococcus xinjiangensis]
MPDVAAPGSGAVVYGLLSLAGMEVALPLSALREVVPCPAEFSALPVTSPGLLGAMVLRELPVPVLDLRARLGGGSDLSGDRVVVILAHGGRLLGIVGDRLRGITPLPEGELHAVGAQGDPLLFSASFRHPVDGDVVSVLDVARLLDLPGVPSVAEPAHQAGGAVVGAGTGTGSGTGARRTLTLLRCGDRVLAMDAAHVHTTLAGSVPRPSVLDSEVCRGVRDYGDREVAVVDPLTVLGLGRLPAEEVASGAGLVLDLGRGYVVLALSAVLDIVAVEPDAVLPVPAFSMCRPELIAGMVQTERFGQCLVLDGRALRDDADLRAYGSVNTSTVQPLPGGPDPAAGSGGAGSPAGRGPSYLTYSLGVDVCTPLEQVAEILPFPETWTPTGVGGEVLGIVLHRSGAVPVLCTAMLLGRRAAPVGPATCLLLVKVDGEQIGFAVDALRSIDPLTWQEPAGADGQRTPPQTLHSAPLVRVGGNERLIPEVDLVALARRVRGDAADAEPAGEAVPALAS